MAVRKIDVSGNAPTGYARGKAVESLDWSAISNKLDTTMQAVQTEKELQRNKIKEESEAIQTTLDNAPLGNHAGRNDTLLEYADNAKQAMLMLDRNLKSGNISLKDYTVAVQNLKDGTNQTFAIMEEWNKDYDEAMARMQNCGKPGPDGKVIDCSAAQEQFQMMQAESLGKLENHALYINPTNFRVVLGKRAKDEEGQLTGGISQDQNDFAEVQQLRNRVKQRIDKYDLEGRLDEIENQLSTSYDKLEKEFGRPITITDARENPMFKEALKNWINSSMTNDVDNGSILMDYIKFNPNTGEEYEFTMDPNEAAGDENKILLVNDPERMNSGLLVPDFSTENGKKQYKVIQDMLETQILGQLDRKIKVGAQDRALTSTEFDRSDSKKGAENYVRNLARLWTGDDEDVTQILSTIGGDNEDIFSIRVVGDDVLITKKDSDGNLIEVPPIPRGDNPAEFIEAIITHVDGGRDIDNLNKAIANSGLYKDMQKGDGVGDYTLTIKKDQADFNMSERKDANNKIERPSDFLLEYKNLAFSSTKNADMFAKNAKEILGFLTTESYSNDGSITQNISDITYTNDDGKKVTLNGGDGDDGSITIFYPEIMTAPITIPTNADENKDKANVDLFNKLIEDLFNSAAKADGKKIRPSDYISMFQEGDWEKFNNAGLFMQLGIIDAAEQWNGGDGVFRGASGDGGGGTNKKDRFKNYNK